MRGISSRSSSPSWKPRCAATQRDQSASSPPRERRDRLAREQRVERVAVARAGARFDARRRRRARRRGSPRRAPRSAPAGGLSGARLEVEEVVEPLEEARRGWRRSARVVAVGRPQLAVVAAEEAAEQVRVARTARASGRSSSVSLRLEHRARVRVGAGDATRCCERELEIEVGRELRQRADRRRGTTVMKRVVGSAITPRPRNHWTARSGPRRLVWRSSPRSSMRRRISAMRS